MRDVCGLHPSTGLCTVLTFHMFPSLATEYFIILFRVNKTDTKTDINFN